MSNDASAHKATTIRAAARATAKASGRSTPKESNVNLKQVIVGVVIACVASVLLIFYAADIFKSFAPAYLYELNFPNNVYVVLDTTSKKAIDYEVYYTVERETWYSEDRVVRIHGKAGSHSYVFALPVKKIYNLRIDFGENPGAVMVNDVRLLGTQKAILSDFENYSFNQIDHHSITPKGQLVFISEKEDPFIIYNNDL